MNYYNEIDPHCCAWLRELIAERLIPDGEIDSRSICDVQPSDLDGFTQCHFFAGIGGWPYALRLAGWPEDRPIWTGSCPCQPLSCAGLRKGHADERHLWPAFYRLIAECKPPTVFGEQVASVLGREWLAGVRSDLEGMGYAVGAADLCAAGVGAPHIRQRLYWVANSNQRGRPEGYPHKGTCATEIQLGQRRAESGLAHSEHGGHGSIRDCASGRGKPVSDGGMGDAASSGCRESEHSSSMVCPATQKSEYEQSWQPNGSLRVEPTGGSLNFWSSSIWHPCRDGKIRRIPCAQPGVLGLDHGLPACLGMDWSPRVLEAVASGFPLAPKFKGRKQLLKGFGNSIVPELAAAFIRAAMSIHE